MGATSRVSAIVLAGGLSTRMGTDKLAAAIGGRTLLDRVLDAVADADPLIVVGPQRPTGRPVTWTRESPPGGGPGAAVAAGVARLSDLLSARPSAEGVDPVVLLLAADLPFAGPAIPRLTVAAQRGAEAAVLVDAQGHDQYLLAAWHWSRLRTTVGSLGPGTPVRTLYAGVQVARLTAVAGEELDCDTPEDLDRAAQIYAQRHL